ncbi:MAG TPA: FtsX-like permease family protein, partial [Vicinamibacterales bacterium]
ASARQVRVSILREAATLTAAGLGVGLVLSVGAAMLASGLLFGVTPTDPRTYLAVFTLLGLVSLAASYIPAWRASRIDPVLALRQE